MPSAQVVFLALCGVAVIGVLWMLEVGEQDEQKAQDTNRALRDERRRKPVESWVVKKLFALRRRGEMLRRRG